MWNSYQKKMEGTNKLKEHMETYLIHLDYHRGLCQSEQNTRIQLLAIVYYIHLNFIIY